MKALLSILLAVTFFYSCGTYNAPYLVDPSVNELQRDLPLEGIEHRLYMIGDAGGFNDKEKNQNYVFNLANKRIKADKSDKSVVFLGDNIYEAGLEEEDTADRQRQERILNAHIELSTGSKTKTFFIPGNHDWNNNNPGGLEAIQRQEQFIKNQRISKKAVKFYPENGCGDPEVVKVNKDLVYIMFDSQWWVHDWESEEKINKGCKVKSRREFLDKMSDLIIKHRNDKVVLFMHHPLRSNGNHGGKFSFKEHVFPFTKTKSWAYLPLPIIGSIYPIARQLGGNNQDNTYPLLKELGKHLEATIRGYDASRVMFVSGHDHFLQHTQEQFIFQKSPIHYVISGSGYKKSFAAKGFGASYVYSKRGYSVVTYYEDGGTWLEFYTISEDGQTEELSYRTQIYDSKPGKKEFELSTGSNERLENITLPPNPDFKKSGVYRFFMGDQFRESWTTPIKSEVFYLDKYHEGLIPTKKGGGLFSRTLRLENESGKEYVMRSMNKDFYKAVPKGLQHLELLKLYSDQNTASIPYGALYISELSDYAGVYHSDPEIVYLDEGNQLGPFKEYFPKGHYLLEARPDGDWSDSDLFGSSEEVVGYNDLLHILKTKTTHFVDQNWVLKSRLFDIFIHDRDRHDDQWRWAAFPEGDDTVYRPVPRDRDWAFFKYGGLIPWIMGNIVDKKLKSFKADCIDVKSLATNANNFDRYFLNELTWEDWKVEIDALKTAMTDDAIEASLSALPPESQEYMRSELVHKLISRREILERDVRKYYDFITKEVEVTGSDEEDIFDITTLPNGDTHVVVYKDSKKHGKMERYNRVLKADETEEIRIYGLAGKDDFNLHLSGKGNAKIRIIGGIGDDDILVLGGSKPNHDISVYDSPDGMDIDNMKYISDHRDYKLQTNEYKRRGFLYDTGLPWLNLGYSFDDGIVFGFGFNSIKHGWRKSPYKSSHLFNITFTPNRGSGLDIKYEGEFVDVMGKGWGFAPSLFVETPDYINFFELGAESNNNASNSQFNWVRRSSYGLSTHLLTRAAGGKIKFTVGPSYESHELQPEDGSILLSLEDFTSEDFERSHFIGLESELRLHTLDRYNKPSRGFLVKAHLKHQYDLGLQNNTVRLGGSVAFFIPLSVRHDIVFGSNSGYQKIFGDALFYQYPTMGNRRYLRPFRNERFRGESIAYQQFDLRFKMLNWNNSVLPLTIGGIAGYDFGQDFYKGEDTGPTKHGWTAGLSYDLVGYFILRTSISMSDEGQYFVFDVGYNF